MTTFYLIIWLSIGILFTTISVIFTLESLRENEPRAPKTGMTAIVFFALATLIPVAFPGTRYLFGVIYLGIILFIIILAIPTTSRSMALKGASGHIVGKFQRFDERDTVFARNRSLLPDTDIYRRYYDLHPETEQQDATRRANGGPVGRIGAIDREHPSNTAMIKACFAMPLFLGPHAKPESAAEISQAKIDSQKATTLVKKLAHHSGADLVGFSNVNSDWAYSHRGEIFYDNWEDWGTKLVGQLPYGVVIGTEMNHEHVGAGPHTPALMESAHNYAKGAYITTLLAQWFTAMGFKAVAHHSRHYDLNMVPLAIDAGLGELGRFGYLISSQFGPRVRLFAVTTDMPLVPDKPVDLGVDRFCDNCLKCATACPSKSIPTGEKTVVNGVKKWKINAETCFDYWAKVGTDCSICMGICPYSRPNRTVHKLARRLLRHSSLAQSIFPRFDNLIYGQRWKPRPVSKWIDYSS